MLWYTHSKKSAAVTHLWCNVIRNTEVCKVSPRSDKWKWVERILQKIFERKNIFLSIISSGWLLYFEISEDRWGENSYIVKLLLLTVWHIHFYTWNILRYEGLYGMRGLFMQDIFAAFWRKFYLASGKFIFIYLVYTIS